MRKIFLIGMLSVIAFAQKTFAESTEFQACNQPYVLCTTATCTAIPGVTDQATCRCIVAEGLSIGKSSCQERRPTRNEQGQKVLISTFSFDNAKENQVMTCKENVHWTDCLDKPCIVDPNNANEAICTCDIKHTNSFVTFGGNCDTSTCSNVLYSGATNAQFENAKQFLTKKLNLMESPTKMCPSS